MVENKGTSKYIADLSETSITAKYSNIVPYHLADSTNCFHYSSSQLVNSCFDSHNKNAYLQ